MAAKRVDLGFVNEEYDSRLLESRYFPSKVGGKPAWLSLKSLPPTERLSCLKCSDQLSFLMQVYSPRDKTEGDAFHRTLFLFVCRNSVCCSNDGDNFVVLRSQLAQNNDFFSPDPPPDDLPDDSGLHLQSSAASKYQTLCVVCGCLGTKSCAQCHSVNYCCKDHQTRHWKAGHKKACGKSAPLGSEELAVSGVTFRELDLEMEEEDLTADTGTRDEEQALQDYQQCQCVVDIADQSGAVPNAAQFTEQDLERMATRETEDDRQFQKFQKRVASNPDQVLRYCKGGEPLWVSVSRQAKEQDIPACSCGAPRQFEFQVLPQLLNHLKVDVKDGNSLDWGTLCVYTCKDSCTTGNKYVTEFLWKQDYTANQ